MDREIFGIILGPVLWGVWRLLRKEYAGALGAFVVAIIGVPVLYRLRDVKPSPGMYYTVGGIWLVVTTSQLWYFRRKAKSRKE